MSINEHPPHHVPVLLESCLQLLDPKEGDSYLDLTAGYGGHAKHFLERTANYTESTLVDRDEFAIKHLSDFSDKGARLMHCDFLSAAKQLVEEGAKYNLILIDLGVSSPQLDRAERGFSFTRSGPLDMRMDQSQEATARDLINRSKESELAEIISKYGEEPRSVAKRYAAAIKGAGDIATTKELADVILSVHRGKWSKVHPATRTFQALRIVVNSELSQVEHVLKLLPALTKKGGRVGIISFHSLEDRLVKKYFNEQVSAGYEAEFRLVNKKPFSGDTYDVSNPRSRSAKLRVAIKT